MKHNRNGATASVIAAAVTVSIASYVFFIVPRPVPQSPPNVLSMPIRNEVEDAFDGYDKKMVIIVPPHQDDKMIIIPGEELDYQ